MGLPFPPGDLPDPGIKLVSPAWPGGFFITEPLCGFIFMVLIKPDIVYISLFTDCLLTQIQAVASGALLTVLFTSTEYNVQNVVVSP